MSGSIFSIRLKIITEEKEMRFRKARLTIRVDGIFPKQQIIENRR